ncbi:MAG: Acetylornithine aminotransferase [uncultured Nocardioidaceae bacterium]|uniref:Acetylornithine aminotransferase n=1 Tax=uncultured Nocardioidaceae bacterium TaxID=253824 RepID=A0A6J4MIX4_9ACTN|nr:MAG: Acetylornithine aminotransferase [uncultured Nocardioidaceae bacterium]
MSDLGARYADAVMNTFGPPKLVLTRGEGAYVWDDQGNRYLDLLGGIAVNALGHGHPALVDAVTAQLRTLGHVSNFFATEPQVELAERLLSLLGHPGHVFFTNSGTEANEAALKLTRRTGRTHLVAAEGAFHGRTMGSLALTAKAAYREPFEPLPGDVTFVPYGDVAALEKAVTDRTAAVVLEPVQGEAGVVVPPDGYLAAARRVAHDHGALLWLDEVQTGIGRTGAWFAHTATGVVPDVVTVAKGLGGGIPVGACIGVGEAGSLLQPGNHGTTFGGNPVAAAAALAVIRTIEDEGLLERATTLGATLSEGLRHSHVTGVRAQGLLVGLDLDSPRAAAVADAAQARGFIVNACTPERIRLAPPLVLTDGQVDDFLSAWPEILEDAYSDGATS